MSRVKVTPAILVCMASLFLVTACSSRMEGQTRATVFEGARLITGD
ncbi:MAG: hypothetical protein HYU27_08655, partial [Acidobacteria bacterium]|nr:hypothetical protein [Acidobacteriota bacterium]